ACFLRALSHQEEGEWAEAVPLWKETLANQATTPQQPDRVLYNLGLCLSHLEQARTADEAAQLWEECLRKYSSSEVGPAAALALAELRLLKSGQLTHNNQAQDAFDAFAKALASLPGPEPWHNTFLALADVRKACESGCLILRQTGHYELSAELARLYEKLAL